MYENTYIQKGQIDFNDTLFVRGRLSSDVEIVETIPAPVTVFENGIHKGKQKINPHISRFVLSNGKKVDVFHIKPVYYQNQSGNWRPMSEIASHYGNKNIVLKEDWADNAEYAFISWLIRRTELLGGQVLIPSPLKYVPVSMYAQKNYASLHFSTLTVYPDPHTETTTVDGRAQHFSTGAWATAQTAVDGTSIDDSSANMYIQVYHRTASNLGIDRYFALFDTSALTSGATISDGVFSVYADQKGDENNDSHGYWNIVQSNPASNTALVVADYDQCGDAVTNPTKGASDIDTTGITVNAYVDFTMTATGRGWISKTGITKLGMRNGQDMDNADPPNSGDGQYLHILCAETSGTSTDPKLVVTYSTTVDVTVDATVLACTFSLPASTVTAIRNVSVSSTVLSATFSTPARTVTTSVSIARGVLSATFSIPSYNVVIADAVITPSPIALTFSIPAFAITTTRSIDVTPSALSATFVVPSFTPTGTSGITVSIGTVLSALFSTPAPTITTTRTVIISSEILQMIFTIPTFTSRGDFWQEKFSAPATSWSDKISQPSTNWSNKY